MAEPEVRNPDAGSITTFARKYELGDRHRPAVVRKHMAYGMFWLITAIITALLGAFFLDVINLDEAKELATIILTPVVSIFGLVVGFFFGASAD
jgi:hypothetical protein